MSPARNATRAALQQLIGDKYEILQWIGGGGMADVFLARNHANGALFAVKVLSESLAGARTAATLGEHPNISEIFEIGEGGGLHYLIMPYVDGEDLSSYLQRHGQLPEAEALHIVQQIAEALIWAGDRQVAHGNLKPSKIRIDLSGRAIVRDFGIAQARDMLGTPGSDLYSFGVLFFELLVGRRPIAGDTLRDIEIQQIDPRFEQVIKRLLAKDPADRYPSARELLEALRTLAESQPLGQPPVQLKPKFDPPEITQATVFDPALAPPIPRKPAAPKNRLIPALLGGIVLLAAGVYVATRPGARSPQPPPANLPRMLQHKNGTMLLVTAGKFIFGAEGEESPNKRQEVDLPAFYVDATEVSNAQYRRFVAAEKHGPPDSDTFQTDPTLPVVGVTLDDAKAYCAWAGSRVPTEQEWEKAARGVDGRTYPWGNPPLASPGKLVAVDEYPERQSPYGALNMSGNASEWTVSEYPVTERNIDDMKEHAGRAEVSRNWCNVKGGSFLLGKDLFLRVYMRRGWPTDQSSPMIGFRCVKDVN